MRAANKLLLVLGAIIALGIFGTANTSAASKGGLTLSPATITLNLAAGSTRQNADFTVTNQYDAPMTISFSFEAKEEEPGAKIKPSGYLAVAQQSVTLAAGESSKQTITLTDNGKLGPGSQLADLLISQAGASGSNIGILPSIRMPLVIVKQDGAVSSVSLAKLSSSRFGFTIPASFDATLHNDGNVIAIPRGKIIVTAPDGSVVRQGVLNTSSSAVAPGDDITLNTPINNLEGAFWPGIYRTTLSYGLGGGQAAKTASGWFFYVAWWHILALAIMGAAGYFGIKYLPKIQRKHPPAHHPPKRTLLIGRDIT